MQKLIELLRVHAQHGFLLLDQAFVDHLHGDANRRGTGALAVPGLEHVELAVLDGELEILDIAVVLLERSCDLAELVVNRGVPAFKIADGVRRTDSRHHVFALRVLQELAVESLLAGCRIASEAHAGRRSFTKVAEDHGLHVDRSAQVVGDLVQIAVKVGAVVEPGTEYGIARAGELRQRVLRERLAGLLLHQRLVSGDDILQILGGQVRIQLRLGFLLLPIEDRFEIVLLHVQHYTAVHLDEAAVAIVGEARIVGSGFHRFDGLVIQPQVQDGIHHARHGEFRAGAHAHQQRVRGVAEFLAHAVFQFPQRLDHLLVNLGRNAVPVLEVDVAYLCRDGETRRHRQIGQAHFGKPGAFAAQRVLHLSIAIGSSLAE